MSCCVCVVGFVLLVVCCQVCACVTSSFDALSPHAVDVREVPV